jgi:hypothetical protein
MPPKGQREVTPSPTGEKQHSSFANHINGQRSSYFRKHLTAGYPPGEQSPIGLPNENKTQANGR